jgi:hypothetical protein
MNQTRDFSAMARNRADAMDRALEARHHEIEARISLIRPLKAKWPDIPLALLDRLLPPVNCRRTRYRLARLAAGRRDLPNASNREGGAR